MSHHPAVLRPLLIGGVLVALLGFLGLPQARAQSLHPSTPSVATLGSISQHVALVESPDSINGGTFATTGFPSPYAPSFTDLTVASIENPASNPLAGFDTVVFVTLADFGTYWADSTFSSRIESFVSSGGKLIMWDSETNPDYSSFIYPFKSNSPGQMGASGSTLTIAEENDLSSANPSSPSYVNVNAVEAEDAVGDANVMTSHDPAWFVDMTATNTNNVTGPVQAYARYGSGLIIWNGLDMDPLSGSSTFEPSSTDPNIAESRTWMLDLQQRWNPDTLPGSVKVFGVALSPHSQSQAVGHPATVTALVTANVTPQPGVTVTFNVTAGPDQGLTRQGSTDSAGKAVFTWTSKSGGTDTLQASAVVLAEAVNDTAYATWIGTAPGRTLGYLMVGSDGGVFAFGGAGYFGSAAGARLAAPIVAMARTPSGLGYWLVGADGGVFTFGDARFYGSASGARLAGPIVAMTRTPSGLGYWLVGADGGVFTFGDARFYGSASGTRLAGPVVDITSTPTGNGYWLIGRDGGVFAFGKAKFRGSLGATKLASPVVSGVSDRDGGGYWLAAASGQIYPLGTASAAFGSPFGKLINAPIVAIDTTPTGNGYAVAGTDGGVFNFGDSLFGGSGANWHLAAPIVHIADR